MSVYDTQKVLELSCAAFRTYGSYIKDNEFVYDSDGKFLFVKHSNKDLVKYALGILNFSNTEQEFRPINLILMPEDAVQAEIIKNYFKRLMFSAVKGTNEFETEINALLESDAIPSNKVGYIACLPSVYDKEIAKKTIKKGLASCEDIRLAEEGESLTDKDCEILRVTRSKNFPAWNTLAIIDNRIVSWMSNKEPTVGPAVVVKAKVKGFGTNYQTGKTETRLNYVKIAQ
jgi:hypothetical protein